jgi:hypothetical protein
MNRSYSFLPVFLVALISFSGCAGYQLGDTKPSAYEGIRKIHVPIFKNDTLEPRLSSLVTNAVLKEMHVDGTYVVSNRSNADAVLVGVIQSIQKAQLRSVRTDTLQSQELLLHLYVDYHLEDPRTGAVITNTSDSGAARLGKSKEVEGGQVILAREGRVIGSTIQFVDNNFQVGERAALSVAAQDLASKLVSQLADGW